MIDANEMIGEIGDACMSEFVENEDGIGVPILIQIEDREYEIDEVATSGGAVVIVAGDLHT